MGPFRAQFRRLLAPAVDHPAALCIGHRRQRLAVIGPIAQHPRFAACGGLFKRTERRFGHGLLQQGREVILEHERTGVIGIALARDAGIVGAQVAVRIVRGQLRRADRIDLPLPRPLVAVR